MHDNNDTSVPTSFGTRLSPGTVSKQCRDFERLFGEPMNSIFVSESLMAFRLDSQRHSPLHGSLREPLNPRLVKLVDEWIRCYSHERVKANLCYHRKKNLERSRKDAAEKLRGSQGFT